jgi:hypothetical protein
MISDLAADIVLVTCVKSKAARPSAAKDLYTSPLFKKQRAYAERAGVPWFILSAEHGLVGPDEWLAPYERFLPETPPSYRVAWGDWVVARLELLAGPLRDKTVEIHAGSTYLDAVRPKLEELGARVLDPLRGLQMGPRLAWYADAKAEPADRADVSNFVQVLQNGAAAASPQDFIAAGRAAYDRPGLYSWCRPERSGRFESRPWVARRTGIDLRGSGWGHTLAKWRSVKEHSLVTSDHDAYRR